MSGLVFRECLGLIGILIGLNGTGCVQQAKEHPKNVKVTVVVILANKHSDKVDPRLVHVAKKIQEKDPEFTGFRLVGIRCESLPVNKRSIVKLIEGQVLEVTIKKSADKFNCVELSLKPPLQGKLEYRAVCSKRFLPIVTRYETRKKKDRLVLAVCVQPCNGK